MSCPLCVVRAIVSGTGLFPVENFEAQFFLQPHVGEAEVDLDRDGIVFVPDTFTKDGQGGYSATGTLKGPFGVFPALEASEAAQATLEAYARDGEVVLIQVEVPDSNGGVRFSASFKPLPDPGAFTGTAYMSRLGEAQ
jgi:hypothetical protein